MDNYELIQWSNIIAWENQKPSVISNVTGVVFKPVTWLVQTIIPSKAIEATIKSCNWMAEIMTDKSDILRDGKVSEISELRTKDLRLSDKMANEVHNWAISLGVLEGGGTGATGLPGMLVDIPALITLSYRLIHKIGLCYGFECVTESDKQFYNAIMATAGASNPKEKCIALLTLRQIQVMIAKNTWKKMTEVAVKNKIGKEAAVIGIRNLAKSLGHNLTKKKALQSIPILGAGVGAAMNASFLSDVGWAARRTFQRRWLEENGIESPVNY